MVTALVSGQLVGQQETNSGLDLPRRDGGPLVVVSETAGLSGDALEDVVHERVHDAHGLGGDAGVGMHLLQHLVEVDRVGFFPPAFLLFASPPGTRQPGGERRQPAMPRKTCEWMPTFENSRGYVMRP